MEHGQRIGRWVVGSRLGRGGIGEVFAVTEARLGLRRALKVYSYDGEDPFVRQRFEAEAQLLARLDHSRIVRVCDVGETADGLPYYVMDLVLSPSGQPQSLAEIPAEDLDDELVGRWYDDLREALACVHAQGIVYRDLKLENALVGPDGHVVLIDFGAACMFEEANLGFVGTPRYLSPEVRLRGVATPRSDWYALGVLCFRLLRGHWCDAGTDLVAELETHDPAWTRILPKLLSLHPEERQVVSFAEMKRAIVQEELCRAEARLMSDEACVGRLAHRCRLQVGVLSLLLAMVVGLVFLSCNLFWARRRDAAIAELRLEREKARARDIREQMREQTARDRNALLRKYSESQRRHADELRRKESQIEAILSLRAEQKEVTR